MATAGHAARRIRDRALTLRSIRVLVSPTPITFAERRSVLQVLEQFGPVEVFKMSPGTYANFISATREEGTAARLVSSSPLTYTFVEPARRNADDIHVADLAEPESFAKGQPLVKIHGLAQQSHGQAQGQAQSQGQDQGHGHGHGPGPVSMAGQRGEQLQGQVQVQEQRQFTLEIFPAPDFRHRLAMAGSPLHDAWPVAYKHDQSFMTTTLKQSLPQTMAGKGLAHWLVNHGTSYRSRPSSSRRRVNSMLPSNMKSSEFKAAE